MSETKFTAGPWQIKSDYLPEDRRTVIANVDGEIFPDGGMSHSYDLIARCDDEFEEFLPECEANARLIAAAPDLYEALLELADAPAGRLNLQAPWTKARAALAKAVQS